MFRWPDLHQEATTKQPQVKRRNPGCLPYTFTHIHTHTYTQNIHRQVYWLDLLQKNTGIYQQFSQKFEV